MGKVMAANLLKAGHRVRAWDKSPEPLHELRRAGADIAVTAADAFRGDAVISMLPNDQALREVFIEGDLLKHGRPPLVSINMGTVSLDCVDALVAALRPQHSYIAATVLGGPTWRRPPSSASWQPEMQQTPYAAIVRCKG
jgi:3-hydroxyisobutyrate dehydrogenase-like beta-hydroxyacid dehydrogenase